MKGYGGYAVLGFGTSGGLATPEIGRAPEGLQFRFRLLGVGHDGMVQTVMDSEWCLRHVAMAGSSGSVRTSEAEAVSGRAGQHQSESANSQKRTPKA